MTEEELAIQTCDQEHGEASNAMEGSGANFVAAEEEHNTQKPKDYTVFLATLAAYIAFFNFSMILFFNLPFKRSLANKRGTDANDIK